MDYANGQDPALPAALPRDGSPRAKLTFHSGLVTGVAKPVLGERRSKPGTFDVPTPISSLTQVRLTNVLVTLEKGPNRFDFVFPSTDLTALNGSFMGSTNMLSGTNQVDGATVPLAPMPLNPDFSQASFDASYSCTADLMAVIPPGGP